MRGDPGLPDDWGSYYSKCEGCGSRVHASEGGCSCWEERRSDALDELEAELKSARRIGLARYVADRHSSGLDHVEDDIAKGERYIYLFVDYEKSSEEYSLTLDNWNDISVDLDSSVIYEEEEQQ